MAFIALFRLAPELEHEVAPPEAGGKDTVCAKSSRVEQTARAAQKKEAANPESCGFAAGRVANMEMGTTLATAGPHFCGTCGRHNLFACFRTLDRHVAIRGAGRESDAPAPHQ
jgi:hypothetical protein